MQHHFDVEIALKYGILEAILLNHFEFWLAKNKANNTNYHDGEYWTYNSMKALSELFPYASQKQIRNALEHLRTEGLIKTGNYNEAGYDRTLWYTLTENGKSICPTGQVHLPNRANPSAPEGKPIPYNYTDNNTDNNTDNTPYTPKGEDVDKENHFNSFWNAYPKKAAKQSAQKAWNKLKPSESLYAEIMKNLERQKNSQQWTKDGGQFIPYPATWLNGRRWEDDAGQQPQQHLQEKWDGNSNPFEEYTEKEEKQAESASTGNPFAEWL